MSENHSGTTAKILLQKIQDGTRVVPLAFRPSHLRCDNSLVEGILSQVSTGQSSDVAVTNCFLYITEYRNFTLPFTLITILPLERSNLNYSITEMPDNLFFPFGEGHRNNSKSLYHPCYTLQYEFGD